MTSKALTTVDKSKAIDVAANDEMTVDAIVARKMKIGMVMERVMKEGEHYGKIPGCGDKPTLLKAGAEVLATTFHLAPTFEIRRSDLPGGHREYEITCTLTHITTGNVLGQGLGSCSTMEKKYRYRVGQRLCPECQQPTIIKSKFNDAGWYCFEKKGGCGAKFPLDYEGITAQETGRTENPDLADTYNTVLKMAKKRAQVDCTLTAVGASDILTQDIEDMEPMHRDEPRRDRRDDRDHEDRDYDGPRDADQPRDRRTPPPQDTPRNAKKPSGMPHDLSPSDPLEASALDLIARIHKTGNELELRELAGECNRMPTGSRARRAVRIEFDQQLASFGQ